MNEMENERFFLDEETRKKSNFVGKCFLLYGMVLILIFPVVIFASVFLLFTDRFTSSDFIIILISLCSIFLGINFRHMGRKIKKVSETGDDTLIKNIIPEGYRYSLLNLIVVVLGIYNLPNVFIKYYKILINILNKIGDM